MKLESLQLDKFKGNALKREQMFSLNGGGTQTDPGTVCGPHGQSGEIVRFDYGYDSYRDGILTYHNRTNIVRQVCLQP
jgi:hypothetical protein